MMNRPLVAGAALAITVAAIGGWLWQHPQSPSGSLALQGNVDVRQADLSFKVAGRIDAMAVQEGDKVAAGQIIATLERTNYQAALDQAAGQQTSAAAALTELENGSRPEEIDQAKAQVAQAEATLVNARLTFKRQQELVKSDFTSHSNYDLAQASLRQAEAQLASSKAALIQVGWVRTTL